MIDDNEELRGDVSEETPIYDEEPVRRESNRNALPLRRVSPTSSNARPPGGVGYNTGYNTFSSEPEPSFFAKILPFLILTVALLAIAGVIAMKDLSVSGVCPEVNCGNSSCPTVPVCPTPTIYNNFSTPNLSCPVQICNPSFTLFCGNVTTNGSFTNCTQPDYRGTNLNLTLVWGWNTTSNSSVLLFQGNSTYNLSYVIADTNYTFTVKANG